jgi:hypothetical protein
MFPVVQNPKIKATDEISPQFIKESFLYFDY